MKLKTYGKVIDKATKFLDAAAKFNKKEELMDRRCGWRQGHLCRPGWEPVGNSAWGPVNGASSRRTA